MLVAVRHNKIVSTLNERETIRVSELSALCGVTEETIRRDLEKLEAQGKLARIHGGAISIKDEDDLPHFKREVINKKEKMSVAREAVKHINENDVISLDASSTALYLARLIPNIPLTVLTNSAYICMELAKNSNVQVINTGGSLSAVSMSFVGPLAVETLEKYYVNKLFFSSKGIDLNWGISDSNELQALVKRKMVEMAETTYLLLDHTKLEKKSFAHIVQVGAIDVLIVDSEATEQSLTVIREHNIQVIKVE